MNPALPEILRGKLTELPRQISFLILGMFRIIGYLPKHLFFFLITQSLMEWWQGPKTECKYEGLLAEMQIEKDFRS